jgi:hypothetical protein
VKLQYHCPSKENSAVLVEVNVLFSPLNMNSNNLLNPHLDKNKTISLLRDPVLAIAILIEPHPVAIRKKITKDGFKSS